MFGVTWYLQHTTLHLCPQAWSCRLWYGEAYQSIESGMLLWRRLCWPNKKTGHEVPSKPVGATSPQPLCIIHLLSVVAPINRLMYQLLLLILLFISFEKKTWDVIYTSDLWKWLAGIPTPHQQNMPVARLMAASMRKMVMSTGVTTVEGKGGLCVFFKG